MAEYIERDALLNRLGERARKHSNDECTELTIYEDMHEVKSAPAVDVTPVVHGRWIKPTKIGYRSFDIPHCSACDGVPCGVDEHTKYCPNCGAKMDGGKSDGETV